MIGRIIHNYRIEELIGEGGMGTVYRAVDTMLGRDVALKMLHPKLLLQSTFLDRFKNEAQILAKLNHPNIAILHNFIKDAEDYFMVMEYVEGENLENLLSKHGNLPPETAIPIVRQALEGLSHAHKKGILHRDIKPANLILTNDGIVKLMDFGIAKAIGGQKLTQVNRLVGTLEYLSPEQIQGQEPSPQSDIYAVGVLLFELLTGKLPFQAQTDYDLMQKIISHKPLKVSELNKHVSKNIESIVTKCLSKKPDQRYTSATGVYDELGKISSTLMVKIPQKTQFVAIKTTDQKPLINKETVVQNHQAVISTNPIRKEFIILGGAAIMAIIIVSWGLFRNDTTTTDNIEQDSVKIEPLKPVNNLENKPNNEALVQIKDNQNNPVNGNNPPQKEEKITDKEKKKTDKKEEKKPVENKPIDSKPIENKVVEAYRPPVIQENKAIENKSIETKPERRDNRVYTLSSNKLTLELTERVQSNIASEGQSVKFRVVGSVVVDGVTLIRSGAIARGVVSAIKKATLLRKETLEIRIKEVEATNGQWVPLKASTFRETATSSSPTVTFSSGQTFIVETSYSEIKF